MPWHGAHWGEYDLKTISLLPPELKLQQKTRRHKTLFLLAGAVMLALFILINIAFSLTLRDLSNEIALVKQQHLPIQREIHALQEYKIMQEQANMVENIIDEALGTEPDWYALLRALGLDFPTGMQLEFITASYTDDEGELLLEGRAPDHQMVLGWIDRLKDVSQYKEIDYLFTLDKGPSGTTGVHFQITAALQPGEPGGGRREMFAP